MPGPDRRVVGLRRFDKGEKREGGLLPGNGYFSTLILEGDGTFVTLALQSNNTPEVSGSAHRKRQMTRNVRVLQ